MPAPVRRGAVTDARLGLALFDRFVLLLLLSAAYSTVSTHTTHLTLSLIKVEIWAGFAWHQLFPLTRCVQQSFGKQA